mgnify:CR=1 FL=1
MTIAVSAVAILAAGVVLMRCICLGAHLSPDKWGTHRLHYALFATSLACLGAGALGVALGWLPANLLLLFGVAGWVAFDRRMPKL